MAAIERVGFVGWRGMVGSVLMERMQAAGDFAGLQPTFFSTSQVGQPAPSLGVEAPPLEDAHDLEALAEQQVIVTCQGGGYTQAVYAPLRAAGWDGYWIDAASAKRLDEDAIIVLDPVNRGLIDEALDAGVRTYVGGNCTVSLMLMALHGLLERGLVEWISSMTYQASSGAGARAMRELVGQMRALGLAAESLLDDPAASILALDRRITATLQDGSLDTGVFGAPLAASLIPWIDRPVASGQTREEWKGQVETHRILGTPEPIPVDGLCVRVGAMRCHSQALTVRLTRDVPIDEIVALLDGANPWVRVVPNEQAATVAELSPARVSGTLDVPIGRLRKMKMGPRFLAAFTVGDQLLWGAAEPLRRMLAILRERSA